MRTRPLILAALSALMLLAGPVARARTTYIRVRLIDLVRSSTVMVVTPARINAAQHQESSVRTTWHVFKIEETLSKRSDGRFAGGGRQECLERSAPGAIATAGEVALPFIDIDRTAARTTVKQGEAIVSLLDFDPPPPLTPPEIGRRYLLMATDCGDGTGRFSSGRMGLFAIDAAGALVADGRPPEEFEHASVATIREMIADLARYDADLAPSGLIVGQVLDAMTNQPVAGVKVELFGVEEREVRASDDGWFVFRDVRAFTYDMAVRGPGRIVAKQRVRLGAGERRTDLSVPVHRLPGIHGVLRDHTGRPIPMVWVSTSRMTMGDAATSDGTGRQARTDDRGHFSFDALDPGDYLVYAPIHPLQEVEPDERPGVTFLPSSFHGTGNPLVNGTPVSIRADEGAREADIVVRPIPMRRVTGVVRRGGIPVANAYIEIRRLEPTADASGSERFTVRGERTRADGTFHVSQMAPGEYVLTHIGEGVPGLSTRVDVTRGDIAGLTFDTRAMTVAQVPARDATMPAGTARIEGVVRDADSPDAAALSRTRVTATNVATRAVRKVQTDPGGSFHIGSLPAGRYELLAERDGFLAVTPGSAVHVPAVVTVGDGGAASATLTMLRAGVVSGAVYDQSGRPVAGYYVTLRRFSVANGPPVMHDLLSEYKSIGAVQNAGLTDSTGRYRIFGVPPGEYVVAALLEGPVPASPQTTREEVEQALADVRTTPGSSGPGFVATPKAPTPPSRSPAATRERLPVYHPGTVDVLSAASVKVEAGAELLEVDIVLIDAAPVPVSGVVRFDGADVAGTIELQFERVDVRGGKAPSAYVRDDRGFTTENVPPGRYVISARTRAESSDRRVSMSGRTVIDVRDAVDDVEITLRPAGAVSGRLIAPSGVVLGSRPMVVRLEPLGQVEGDPGPSVRASGDGTFKLQGVAPGRYRLRNESGNSEPLPWAVQGIGVGVGGVLLEDGVLEVSAGSSIADVVVHLGAR